MNLNRSGNPFDIDDRVHSCYIRMQRMHFINGNATLDYIVEKCSDNQCEVSCKFIYLIREIKKNNYYGDEIVIGRNIDPDLMLPTYMHFTWFRPVQEPDRPITNFNRLNFLKVNDD
jgi:hypothetical protein